MWWLAVLFACAAVALPDYESADVTLDRVKAVHAELDSVLPRLCELPTHARLCQHVWRNPGWNLLDYNSGQFHEQVRSYFTISEKFRPRVVCEVGFNAGHSAVSLLVGSPGAAYRGFDQPPWRRISEGHFHRLQQVRRPAAQACNQF